MTARNSPDRRPDRRRSRWWLWGWAAIASVMLAACGLWIFVQIKIATMVEARILDFAHHRGIDNIRLSVRQITPWQADFHALQVGDPTGDQLGFDSLVLDYTPAGLRAHVIDRVQLSGLEFTLANSASGWTLAGLPRRLKAPAKKQAQDHQTDWRFNHLKVYNSRLVIRHQDRRIDVPFELQMHATEREGARFAGALNCRPWGQPISAAFQLNLSPKQLIVDELTASVECERLSQAIDAREAIPLKGRLTATGQARLMLDPLALETAEAQIRLPEKFILGPRLEVRALNPDIALVDVRLAEDRSWSLEAADFVVTSIPNLRVRDLKSRLAAVDGGWRLAGTLDLNLHAPADAGAAGAPKIPNSGLPVRYEGQWLGSGQWSLDLAGEGREWKLGWPPKEKEGAVAGQMQFTPQFRLAASGLKDNAVIAVDARLMAFKGMLEKTTVRIPALTIRASGEGPWRQLQGRCAVDADDLRLNAAQLDGRLPRLAVQGDFMATNGRLQIAGEARLARGVVRLPDRQIRLEGLQLKVPFSWPYNPSTTAGRLHLTAATWQDLALGEVSGRIRQQADGAAFRLTHQSPLLPGGRLQVDGRLGLEAGSARPWLDASYRLERPASAEDIDLGRLRADLAGIHFNGRIQAEGRGRYQAGQMQAGLQIKLSGGRLVQAAPKRGLTGLSGKLDFPNLPSVRTAPQQQVFFERAFIGDIAATKGRLDFQIEPGGVLFLEKSRFKWCDGSIYLPAARISPSKEDYDVTLWCDRLKLALILEQLGAARAEGGGTVSGRIPVSVRRGQLLIEDGFLFSSPGEGGTIRLRGTEMLTAGIPPGTPQYNQLELARRALEEYDYDWVKLGLATVPREDLLRLKLQLSGRPARPLAFIYDSRTGGFVPAGPESPGSRFQEIKLDVNFSLPLNRLLEYKDLLKLFSQRNGDLYVEKMGSVNGCPAGRNECRLHPAPG